MWICPICGEPHQAQFRECWKCAANEMNQHVAAAPLPPEHTAPPRELRSLGSVLLRAVVGFVVGLIFGVALFHRNGISLEQAATLGAIFGLVVGIIVGVFVWVVFPFKPMPVETRENDLERTEPS